MPEFTNFTECAGMVLPSSPPDVEEQLRSKTHSAGGYEFHASFHHKFWIPPEDSYGVVAYRERGHFYQDNGPTDAIQGNLYELRPDKRCVDTRLPKIARYFGIHVMSAFVEEHDNEQSVYEIYASLPGIHIIQEKRRALNSHLPDARQIIGFEAYDEGSYPLQKYFDSLRGDILPLSNGRHSTLPTYGELYAIHDAMHLVAITGISTKLRSAMRTAIEESVMKDAINERTPGFEQKEVGRGIDNAFTIEGVSQATLPPDKWQTLWARDRYYWLNALGIDPYTDDAKETFEPYRIDVSRQLDAVVSAIEAIDRPAP